ncbi:MAG: Spy/CpxP family protein refolding chaperone [Polyangiales bacterium]
MLGLLVGTLCLIALIATLRRRRYHRFAYAGPHWHGPGFWAAHSPAIRYGARFGRPGRGAFLRVLFAHLDTTHGQEKALAQIAERVRERLAGTREELVTARKELAAVVGGDVIDGAALDAAVGRHKAVLEKLGPELTQTLISVHEVLDGAQRKQLAELIAEGPRALRGFGRGGL